MKSLLNIPPNRRQTGTDFPGRGLFNGHPGSVGALSTAPENERLESFRDIYARFSRNTQGFWEDYRTLILLFALALLCDAAGTMHFMLVHGIEFEIHPFVRWASYVYGPITGPLVGALFKFTLGLILSVYCRKAALWIFSSVSIISFLAGWYNVLAFQLYVTETVNWLPY